MEYFTEIESQVIKDNGEDIIAFIMNTDHFNEAKSVFGNFIITPQTINARMLQAKSDPGITFPKDSYLRIELAFEDLSPWNAFELYLDEEKSAYLKSVNQSAKRIRFYMKGKNGFFDKSKLEIIHEIPNYTFDWSGTLGFLIMIRWYTDNFIESQIFKNIDLLKQLLIEVGFCTGIYTEIGYLYKLLGNYDKAIENYEIEIENGLDDNGQPGIGVVKAINNLATVYKNKNEIEKAAELYKHALKLNPNYFEPYLSLCGLTEEYDLQFKCITRAAKIRGKDENLYAVITEFSKIHNKDLNQVINEIKESLDEIDLSVPCFNF